MTLDVKLNFLVHIGISYIFSGYLNISNSSQEKFNWVDFQLSNFVFDFVIIHHVNLDFLVLYCNKETAKINQEQTNKIHSVNLWKKRITEKKVEAGN